MAPLVRTTPLGMQQAAPLSTDRIGEPLDNRLDNRPDNRPDNCRDNRPDHRLDNTSRLDTCNRLDNHRPDSSKGMPDRRHVSRLRKEHAQNRYRVPSQKEQELQLRAEQQQEQQQQLLHWQQQQQQQQQQTAQGGGGDCGPGGIRSSSGHAAQISAAIQYGQSSCMDVSG